MPRTIPPLDLLFYLMETPESPKHVGALQIFERPADAPADYMTDIVARMREIPAVAPFNCRPRFPRTRLPYWQTVDEMEMEYHLRHSALPAPGTMEQLMTVVQRLHAGVLDRNRPGWICQVIEGLEHNRFAVYTKIHHAYIDGMSGVRRMYGTLSATPDDKEIRSSWGFQPAAGDKTRRAVGIADRLRGAGASLLAQGRALAQVNRELSRVAMEQLRLRRHSANTPFNAPRTGISAPVSTDLRSLGALSLPLDQLKAVSTALQCTLNDLVLALVDAALHDYLDLLGEPCDRRLVAMCPMSLRKAGDESANTQVASLLVELGEPGAPLQARVQQVSASAESAKQEARNLTREALMDYVVVLGGLLELLQRTGLEQVVTPSYNVLVSNVPGPGGGDLFLAGSRLVASYPISTLTPGVNINVTVLSHGNRLDFGLLADRHALPDLNTIVGGIAHHFEALATELGVGGTGRGKAAKRASGKRGGRRTGQGSVAAGKVARPSGKKSGGRAAGKAAAGVEKPAAPRRTGTSRSPGPKARRKPA
jgi:WS/DGAT/MGAT family acyltransferase